MNRSACAAREYHSLDVWRSIAMFLVVAIHVPFPGITGALVITFGKTAVPFFIIIAGFFCYREDDAEFCARLLRQIKKLAVIAVLSNILFAAIMQAVEPSASIQDFISTYFSRQHLSMLFLANHSPFADHLWFLGSMVYAMLLVLLLVKIRLFRTLMYVSPLFLAAYIFLTYRGVNFIYCRNALMCTMPYFMYGCILRRHAYKIRNLNPWLLIILTLSFSALSVLELSFWKNTGTVFIGPEFLVVTLTMLLIKYRDLGKGSVLEAAGRRDTLFVYIFHFVGCILVWMNWESFPDYAFFFLPPAIYIASIIAAELYLLAKDALIKAAANYPLTK